MWLLLKALTLIWCSSLVSGLPALSYNEKPQSNSTVVLQNSTTTTNDTETNGPSVTPTLDISEATSSSLAPSSSSSTSTSSQLTSSSSSSYPDDAPSSSRTPPSVPASPSPPQQATAVELTTVPYNTKAGIGLTPQSVSGIPTGKRKETLRMAKRRLCD
uniref:Uncharacterized protein n=1 Tax=Lygus hesperus TaxID=30085 RepID=A0A146M8N2_LYGHE